VPLCDGDVKNIQGREIYFAMVAGTTQHQEQGDYIRSISWVDRGNHNMFNTEWTMIKDSTNCLGQPLLTQGEAEKVGIQLIVSFMLGVAKPGSEAYLNEFNPSYKSPLDSLLPGGYQRAYSGSLDSATTMYLMTQANKVYTTLLQFVMGNVLVPLNSPFEGPQYPLGGSITVGSHSSCAKCLGVGLGWSPGEMQDKPYVQGLCTLPMRGHVNNISDCPAETRSEAYAAAEDTLPFLSVPLSYNVGLDGEGDMAEAVMHAFGLSGKDFSREDIDRITMETFQKRFDTIRFGMTFESGVLTTTNIQQYNYLYVDVAPLPGGLNYLGFTNFRIGFYYDCPDPEVVFEVEATDYVSFSTPIPASVGQPYLNLITLRIPITGTVPVADTGFGTNLMVGIRGAEETQSLGISISSVRLSAV
jgi:hypothetical protein